MAWPHPFYRHTPNTRICWGYRFELTPEHMTPEQAEPLKHSYDVLGEQVLDRLNELSPPPRKELPRNNSQFSASVQKDGTVQETDGDQGPKHPPRDLYAILQAHKDTDELLQRFWREVSTVPPWVDWEQLRRGQDVFYRYGAANLTGLAFQSLLGGMGAARVVETLARTGGFSTKVARRRLFETTQHILQCTKSLESIQPDGDGFASTIRVRLLHAAVRQRILALAAAREGYYDVSAWGIPINDLDSMATIASFSSELIFLSLPRQGLYLRPQERLDYIALWRWIAHVVGAPTDAFKTPESAKQLMEALLLHEIHPTATSRIMANNVIQSLAGQPPTYTSAAFLSASARWLNGNALCDALGVPRPGLYYSALVAGQCLFFCFWAYISRSVPSWDARKIAILKAGFYRVIVHSPNGLAGTESTFDFKYVPEYSTITEMGMGSEHADRVSDDEIRNRNSFLVGVAVLGIGVWVSWRVVGAVVGAFFAR